MLKCNRNILIYPLAGITLRSINKICNVNCTKQNKSTIPQNTSVNSTLLRRKLLSREKITHQHKNTSFLSAPRCMISKMYCSTFNNISFNNYIQKFILSDKSYYTDPDINVNIYKFDKQLDSIKTYSPLIKPRIIIHRNEFDKNSMEKTIDGTKYYIIAINVNTGNYNIIFDKESFRNIIPDKLQENINFIFESDEYDLEECIEKTLLMLINSCSFITNIHDMITMDRKIYQSSDIISSTKQKEMEKNIKSIEKKFSTNMHLIVDKDFAIDSEIKSEYIIKCIERYPNHIIIYANDEYKDIFSFYDSNINKNEYRFYNMISNINQEFKYKNNITDSLLSYLNQLLKPNETIVNKNDISIHKSNNSNSLQSNKSNTSSANRGDVLFTMFILGTGVVGCYYLYFNLIDKYKKQEAKEKKEREAKEKREKEAKEKKEKEAKEERERKAKEEKEKEAKEKREREAKEKNEKYNREIIEKERREKNPLTIQFWKKMLSYPIRFIWKIINGSLYFGWKFLEYPLWGCWKVTKYITNFTLVIIECSIYSIFRIIDSVCSMLKYIFCFGNTKTNCVDSSTQYYNCSDCKSNNYDKNYNKQCTNNTNHHSIIIIHHQYYQQH
jgi:hypothetical protein